MNSDFWCIENAAGRTHIVGLKLPNAWNLSDMLGNVYEWCADWYVDSYHEQLTHTDNPTGPKSGECKVVRGGSWRTDARNCRPTFRNGAVSEDRFDDVGFRLVRVIPDSFDTSKIRHPLGCFYDTLGESGKAGPAMMYLEGGYFIMGSEHGQDDEKPKHKVFVSSFSLSKYPVTYGEYVAFVKATRRVPLEDQAWGPETHPVVDVSWHDAQAYCDWLSEQTGEHYLLPTEAEWECACRGETNEAS